MKGSSSSAGWAPHGRAPESQPHRSLEWLPAGFARAAAVLLGGRAGFHALGLVSGVLLARGLGPAGRGAFFAVLLWPTILGWLATLGITKATTYLRARHPEYERDLASIGLWVSLVAGGALALGLQPWLPWLLHGYPPSVVGLGRLALLLVPVMAFSDILMGMFDGAREYRLLTAFRLSLPVLQAVGLAVLLLGGWLTVTSAVWAPARGHGGDVRPPVPRRGAAGGSRRVAAARARPGGRPLRAGILPGAGGGPRPVVPRSDLSGPRAFPEATWDST